MLFPGGRRPASPGAAGDIPLAEATFGIFRKDRSAGSGRALHQIWPSGAVGAVPIQGKRAVGIGILVIRTGRKRGCLECRTAVDTEVIHDPSLHAVAAVLAVGEPQFDLGARSGEVAELHDGGSPGARRTS